MNNKCKTRTAYAMATLVLLIGGVQSSRAAALLGSEWTYQGKLNLAGEAVNDTADFEFTLWDEDVAGNMIGAVVAVSNVAVVDGLFTVELDFGVLVFDGDARWLEIDVRSPHDPGDAEPFTTLSPRQPLTANPYSLQTRGLFVDDAGNVGIGTTAPMSTLDVAGEMRIQGIRLPAGFNIDPAFVGTSGNYLSFGHVGVSEDFIGYRDNTFFFKDSLSGGDSADPNVVVGGNVGIGAESPSAKLDVLGTTRLTGDVSINGNLSVDSDVLFVDGAAGSVGIGTATPEAGLTLDVNGATTIRTPDTHLRSGFPNGTKLSINNDSIGQNSRWVLKTTGIGDIPGWGDFAIEEDESLRMIIRAGGNVGIGTEFPGAKLDVLGTTRLTGDVSINGNLSVDSDKLFVDGAAGSVGIGTATPEEGLTLDVNGATTIRTPDTNLRSGVPNGTKLSINNDSIGQNSRWVLKTTGIGDIPGWGDFAIEEDESLRMIIRAGGNVGIGTEFPSAKLDVLGTTQLTGDVSIDGNLSVDSDRLVVDGAAGSVGIGTATPEAGLTLDVNGATTIRAPDTHLRSGVPNGTKLSINNDSIGQNSRWVLKTTGIGDIPGWGDFAIEEDESLRMIIRAGGNVGIGTESPAEALEVVGTVSADRYIGDGSGLSGVSRVGSTVDLHNVAMLRWDLLNSTYPTGAKPWAVAFDGANVWVANRDDDTVTKLRASDGANLGTFNVGSSPTALAFDGTNVWVANEGSANVTKLRASDGANLGTFNVGSAPRDLAFDGANVWVANSVSNDVTKLRASDGANLGTFAGGSSPTALAFDGANVWVVNAGSHDVTKRRASDWADLGTFPVGPNPRGVAFDGANVWVVDNVHAVTKLRASDGANLGTFAVGDFPRGLAFDGAIVWVVNSGDDTVTKLRASDGANLGTLAVGQFPAGVAFDGANVWVVNGNAHTVTRLSLVK